MIKSTKDIQKIPQEIHYNKITIGLAIILAITSYLTWSYSMGIMIWFTFILLCIGLITFCFLPLPSIFFAIPLTFAVIITTINSFTNDFTNTFTLTNVDEDKMAFFFALEIKKYFIKHQELGAIWTGLLFLLIFWSHPDKDKKRIAYNPFKITDYIKEEPKDFQKLLVKIVITTILAVLQSKILTTLFLWYLFSKLLKTLLITKTGEFDKQGATYLAIYFFLTFSYTLFGTNKSPLDALIGIITMNP